MKRLTLSVFAIAIACGGASAHDGRRYEVLVSDNMLYARGYISDGIDDGGGLIRPYYNSQHGHWANHPNPAANVANALLPGFDVITPGALAGNPLVISLTGASKWVSPPMMPGAGVVPDLVPLDAGEVIEVTFDTTISTSSLGSFELVDSVHSDGNRDLDLLYDIDDRPSGVIYVLEFRLSSPGSGITPSDTVHVILSPDGADAAQKLHHASLYLEQYLGTPIPTPAPMAILGAAGLCATRRRR